MASKASLRWVVLRQRKIDGKTYYCIASYYLDPDMAEVCARALRNQGHAVRKIKSRTPHGPYYEVFIQKTPAGVRAPRVPYEIIGGLKTGGDLRSIPGKTLGWAALSIK